MALNKNVLYRETNQAKRVPRAGFPLAALAALAAMTPATLTAEDPFSQFNAMSDGELAEFRGGYRVNGIDMNFAAEVRTNIQQTVDGLREQVELTTQIRFDEMDARWQVAQADLSRRIDAMHDAPGGSSATDPASTQTSGFEQGGSGDYSVSIQPPAPTTDNSGAGDLTAQNIPTPQVSVPVVPEVPELPDVPEVPQVVDNTPPSTPTDVADQVAQTPVSRFGIEALTQDSQRVALTLGDTASVTHVVSERGDIQSVITSRLDNAIVSNQTEFSVRLNGMQVHDMVRQVKDTIRIQDLSRQVSGYSRNY